MKRFAQAWSPAGLTLAALIFFPGLPQERSIQFPLALGLALVWLLAIALAGSRRVLGAYLLTWSLLLILLLLRIKINMEGVIALPAVLDWLSQSLLIPFHGLVDSLGGLHQWSLAAVLASLMLVIIGARLRWGRFQGESSVSSAR